MKRWGPEIDDAIWGMICEGIPATEMKRRLDSGRAGLPYPTDDISIYTVRYKIRRNKQWRGEIIRAVPQGGEVEAADDIQRELLQMLSHEAARLRGIAKVRGLTPTELKAADQAARTVSHIRKELRAEPKPDPEPAESVTDPDDFLAALDAELGTKPDDA